MKDRAAYQAAGASQQTVESTGTPHLPSVSMDTEKARAKKTSPPGLTFPRFFTEAGIDPFDEVEWEFRAAVIGSESGNVVFEQRDVEIPKAWSQQATNIVVSNISAADRHARARAQRAAAPRPRGETMIEWGRSKSNFASEEDLQAF
jgi:ribonucleoside-diphosphate reductase alpha chain